MALVQDGLVEIVVDDVVVAVCGAGDLIGEMGFVLGTRRTAKVVVAAPGTVLLVLGPDAPERLEQPADRERLWKNLARALARKLEVQTAGSH
ncbi:MAG: CRP-like cAMP-binding protein [Kiritimatiellia bacterium]|jgi:CRP-like cAMP-binding protein